MSKLQTRFIDDTYLEYYNTGNHDLARIYLKSDADKVIAEKDAEIERLEILCANYRHDCDNLAISNEQAKRAARTLLKKMNHNKYKRCLAMAKLAVKDDYAPWNMKWHQRWLKLAEKLKEAK